MSVATPFQIMKRIEIAPPSSPIAVFFCNVPGHLNAVFANTTQSQMYLKQKDKLVGIYHNKMDLDQVQIELNDHKT